MSEDTGVTREKLFEAQVAEAAGFYKLIVVTASSFLGGSILFIEKIAPHPNIWTLIALAVGWLSLICSIGLVAWVRYLNLESARMAMDGNVEGAMKKDSAKHCLSKFAVGTLLFGMLGLAGFGFGNSLERECQMGNDKDNKRIQEKSGSEHLRDSVDFGSAVKTTVTQKTIEEKAETHEKNGNNSKKQEETTEKDKE